MLYLRKTRKKLRMLAQMHQTNDIFLSGASLEETKGIEDLDALYRILFVVPHKELKRETDLLLKKFVNPNVKS